MPGRPLPASPGENLGCATAISELPPLRSSSSRGMKLSSSGPEKSSDISQAVRRYRFPKQNGHFCTCICRWYCHHPRLRRFSFWQPTETRDARVISCSDLFIVDSMWDNVFFRPPLVIFTASGWFKLTMKHLRRRRIGRVKHHMHAVGCPTRIFLISWAIGQLSFFPGD